jgi:hypothetical protein
MNMAKSIIKNVTSKIVTVFDEPITNKQKKIDLELAELFRYISTDEELNGITTRFRTIEDAIKKGSAKRAIFSHAAFSGTFSYCDDKSLIKHSELICIDIDGLDESELKKIREIVIKDVEHTVLCFISPSGNGLKIVYGMNPDEYSQGDWYEAYRLYLSKLCNIPLDKIDKSCKNVSRACFLCYDSTAYITSHLIDNEISVYALEPEEFLNQEEEIKTDNTKNDTLIPSNLNFSDKNSEENFRALYALTESVEGPYGSPRQTWIQRLASRCNTFGMGERVCLAYMIKHISNHPESLRKDKPMNEKDYVYKTVKDVYSRYSKDFGTWTMDKGQKDKNSPLIPDVIYDYLIPFFKSALSPFTDRDRDMVLLSTLGLLSGIMPTVRGRYGGTNVYPNLYIFIIASAASGKGCLKFVKMLGEQIHFYLIESFLEDLKKFELQMEKYKDPKNKGAIAKPEEPKKKRFFIPGNTSSSAIIKAMSDNNCQGVIFETEADSLSESLKQDWGNFSDLLRNAFHHESVNQLRRTNDEDLELQEPKLSVVLSGTPNQLPKLIPDVENGLMSRFCFYTFKRESSWKNQFIKSEESYDTIFKRMGKQVKVMYDCFKRFKAINIRLTEDQEETCNMGFEMWHKEFYDIVGEESTASVKRLGLINFRICMILSAIRWYHEDDSKPSEIICNNDDFYVAMELTEVLKDHTKMILGGLSSKGVKDISFRDMGVIAGISKSKIHKMYNA